MRKKSYGTLKVRAISGTYVVFLAFDMKEADANGLKGFAIQRTRLSDGESIWLRGQPCALTDGPATSVTIATEPLAGTMHDVHLEPRRDAARLTGAAEHPTVTMPPPHNGL